MSKGEKWTLAVGIGTFLLTFVCAWMAVLHEAEHHEGLTTILLTAVTASGLFGLNGYSIYRNVRDARRAKQTTETGATIAIECQDAGSQSSLLYYFAISATQVADRLEDTWHHWNQAGESLANPLGDGHGLKNITSETFIPLTNERRDFMVLYMENWSRFKAEFPKFITPLVEYPSQEEYRVVLGCLREHATLVRNTADNIFNSGKRLDL
jgi:hypothetical protein